MPYIGNQPAEQFTSFATQEFSTSATTSYTLDHAVTNENEIALFINNVRQQPGSGKAYTATGTALTLSAATASTDTMYCVFLGRALQTVTPATNSITGSMINYPLTTFSSTGIDDNADATAITIDSSEKVGIQATSPVTTLDVGGSLSGGQGVVGKEMLISQTLDTAYNDGVSGSWGGLMLNNNDSTSTRTATGLHFTHGTSGVAGFVSTSDTSQRADLRFITRGSGDDVGERVQISDDGDVYVGATSGSIGTVGVKMFNTLDSTNKSGMNIVTAGGNTPIAINRSTNDGTLIQFKQANSEEGTISVSGSTVSYNGFTGTHWSRLSDNSKPTILRGTVMESLDEMVDWYNLEFDVITKETKIDADGNEEEVTTTDPQKIPHLLTGSQSAGDVITYNHQGTDYQATIVKEADIKHMKSKVSDTVDAKNVYGVFSHWDFGDDDGINDIIVASVGSFVVRINSGETVTKGDLLQSNGDGTAKVQSDDNVKSSSFAKVLSNTKIETYSDGSYIVPCSLMC